MYMYVYKKDIRKILHTYLCVTFHIFSFTSFYHLYYLLVLFFSLLLFYYLDKNGYRTKLTKDT